MDREVKENELYKHFKGDIIKVINIGYDTETLEKKVIYEHNGKIWIRDYEMFLSKVDKEKYPSAMQEYRFEIVSNDGEKNE